MQQKRQNLMLPRRSLPSIHDCSFAFSSFKVNICLRPLPEIGCVVPLDRYGRRRRAANFRTDRLWQAALTV